MSSSAYIRNISMCIIRTQGRRKKGVITLEGLFFNFFLLFRGGSWFFIHTGLCRKSNLRLNFRFPPGTTQAGRCLTAVLNGNWYTSRDKRIRHSKDYFCSRWLVICEGVSLRRKLFPEELFNLFCKNFLHGD